MFRALLCPSSGARDYDVDYIRMPGRVYIYIYIFGCDVLQEPLLGGQSIEIFADSGKYSSQIYFYIGTDDTLR